MSLVKDDNALSEYDKALRLLKDNPPEQRLDIPYALPPVFEIGRGEKFRRSEV
ncbi:hypothetical protein V1506DRAFT_508380 [Lipomyces tetrasporus]